MFRHYFSHLLSTIYILTYISLTLCVSSPDNSLTKMYWPGDYPAAASDAELAGGDRLKTETLANPDLSLGRDNRTPQDSVIMLLPSVPNLNTHPHRGKLKGLLEQGCQTYGLWDTKRSSHSCEMICKVWK